MQSIGKKGEQLAADYLEGNGYQIEERNFRFKRAEVDIICRKAQLLIFVEVKYRSSKGYGLPEEFVSVNQQEKIISAAEEYMLVNDWSGEVRFDILAILSSRGAVEIMHLKDAFY